MKICFIFLIFFINGIAAIPSKDTLYFKQDSFNSEKFPAGIWNPPSDLHKKNGEIILWFHGGMGSSNCSKGLVAGSDLSEMLKNFTVISPSSCGENHWLKQDVIKKIDEVLDEFYKKYEANYSNQNQKISLVGISDGALGVIAYSLWGKRKINKRLLMSSYGKIIGEAFQIASLQKLQQGQWLFFQGGKDRLYPINETLPWINEFCKNIKTECKLQYDPEGIHDWNYWQNVKKDEILRFFKE